MPVSRHQRLFPWLAAVILIGAIICVYSPGLHGPFMFDDYINIVDNPDVAMHSLNPGELARAAGSGVSSNIGRPLAYVSFALNHYMSGGFESAFVFKLTNIVIHSVNTLLVLWLVRLLSAQLARRQGHAPANYEYLLPFLAAAIWALHPIQLNSVLFVVQRMTSLSALFVLAGLVAYVSGRQYLPKRPRRGIILMTTGILGGTGLGMLAKETAVLLLPYAMVIEFTLFHNRNFPWRVFTTRRTVYATAAGIGLLLLGLWAGGHLDWIAAGYRTRNFSLAERLLTEARVLWFYFGLLLVPGINRLTLFHDDFILSTGWLSPWTTLPAILGLAALLVASVMLRRKYPVPAFAILWFLVGHSLESGVLALELVHEHRNYLPSLGPLAAIVYGLAALARGRYRLVIVAWLSAALILAFTTYVLATSWRDDSSLAQFMLRHHPASARSHEAMAGIYLWKRHNPVMAMEHYRVAAELAPHEISYLVKLVLTAAETDPETVQRQPPATSAEKPGIWSLLRVKQQNRRSVFVLDGEIHDRITRTLTHEPIRVGAYIVFNEMVSCIRERPQICGDLRRQTGDWLEIAIDNPRAPIKVRLQLMQLLVGLYIDRGRLREAQALTERALAVSPDNPSVNLMHANVLFLSDRLEDAERALHLFEHAERPGYENEWQQAGYLRSLIWQ
ncbi:MAG: tetratricopeptide repeat protein, partial [Gammaproteobacteria bacterium]|nr:tetratricopeptide repeat protein [Gammaproteobacteria bacterium]